MAELSGSLGSFGLLPLTRFLGANSKTGDLLITRDHWIGQLSFVSGTLTAAAAEHEFGYDALTFIAGALACGEFEFLQGEASLAPNLGSTRDPLVVLEQAGHDAQAWQASLPAPTAIPWRSEATSDNDASGTDLQLGRAAIYILLEIDGQRCVRDIAARHGIARSLRALATLLDAGLVTLREPVRHASGPANAVASIPSGAPDAVGSVPSRAPEAGASAPSGAPSAVGSVPSGQPGAVASIPTAAPGAVGSVSSGAVIAADAGPDSALQRGAASATRRLRRATRSIPGISALSELLQAVVVAGVLVLVTRAFLQNFRVDGVSMQPTFEAGQVLVVNRAAYFHLEGTPLERLLPTTEQGSVKYLFGGPQRGDIVVFRAPPQPDADYIKRVIGLPGERVQVRDGRVFINGQQLEEPYIRFPANYSFPSNGEPLVVPDATYFVLGDNRPESFDSHLGWVVPVDHLVGRAWVRYWPPNEVAVVDPGRPGVVAANSAP